MPRFRPNLPLALFQIAAVDDEDDFADARQLAQVVGHFVGRQGLARTCRVPDIAGLTAAARVGIDGVADGFDSMNLVGPQHDEGFPFTVEDRILGNHAVRRRDGKDRLGKGDVFRHRLVILIEPSRKELLIEVAFASRGDIARIGRIGDDEHLERRVNIPESSFFEVLLNLVEGFPIGMTAVLQFNLDHGETVNQQSDVAPAVPVHLFLPVKFDLK